MPTKTKMLEYGGFVRRPELPADAGFAAYLRQIDALLDSWQRVASQWQKAPFSPELLERKKAAEGAFDDYAALYDGQYTIKYVERDPAFLPITQFFARHRPVREPFAILHCSLDLPLHTVRAVQAADMAGINAALDEQSSLLWWQRGPLGHPCYLFGECIWELKPSELTASDKGLTLLFEQTTEQDRLRRNRLTFSLSGAAGAENSEFISEAVRVAVWRRSGGKCAKCGGRQRLEFARIVPSSRGGASTVENIRLLCARCGGPQGV